MLALKLLPHLERLKEQDVRIYRTYVYKGSSRYVFTTTSKDLHLGIGTFDEEMRMILAQLVTTEKNLRGDSEILVSFIDEEQYRQRVLFTVTDSSTDTILTMSPVRK